jgi:hypothetical protein
MSISYACEGRIVHTSPARPRRRSLHMHKEGRGTQRWTARRIAMRACTSVEAWGSACVTGMHDHFLRTRRKDCAHLPSLEPESSALCTHGCERVLSGASGGRSHVRAPCRQANPSTTTLLWGRLRRTRLRSRGKSSLNKTAYVPLLCLVRHTIDGKGVEPRHGDA